MALIAVVALLAQGEVFVSQDPPFKLEVPPGFESVPTTDDPHLIAAFVRTHGIPNRIELWRAGGPSLNRQRSPYGVDWQGTRLEFDEFEAPEKPPGPVPSYPAPRRSGVIVDVPLQPTSISIAVSGQDAARILKQLVGGLQGQRGLSFAEEQERMESAVLWGWVWFQAELYLALLVATLHGYCRSHDGRGALMIVVLGSALLIPVSLIAACFMVQSAAVRGSALGYILAVIEFGVGVMFMALLPGQVRKLRRQIQTQTIL